MLLEALMMAAALSEPAPPPSTPPGPPPPGIILSGDQEMTLTFEEKGKKREIVLKMHGDEAPVEVIVDGKAVKDVELRFSADRVGLLPERRAFAFRNRPGDRDFRVRLDRGGDRDIRVHIDRALELADKEADAAGKDAEAASKRRVEIFRFESDGGPGDGGSRSCVDSGTEITCTFKKPGQPTAPEAPTAPQPPAAPK